MRGFPPFHLLICVIAFALFAIPLARLTFARPETVGMKRTATAPKADADSIPTRILIRYAHQPKTLSLKYGDLELVPKEATFPASTIELKANFNRPSDGIEMTVAATWPQGTPDTALAIELEPDGLDSKAQTRWSTGLQVSEIISFNWTP
jgi:hypothetical protein